MKKVISIMIILMVIFNLCIPIISFAVEETENISGDTDTLDQGKDQEKIIDNEDKKDEEQFINEELEDRREENESDAEIEKMLEPNNENIKTEQEYKEDEIKAEESLNTENETTEENVEEEKEIDTNEFVIEYNTHVQNIGWQGYVQQEEVAGTEGKSLGIEAIKIKGENIPENVELKYQVRIQNDGWQGWKNNDEIAGTEGKNKRIEAIKIYLDSTEEYTIMYRTHIQDIGWQEWKFDGQIAGSENQNRRIEAIQIKITEKKLNGQIIIDSPAKEQQFIKCKTNSIEVKGSKLANISDTYIKAYVDGIELESSLITYFKNDSVINNIYDCGTKVQNPEPGFKFNYDITNIENSEHIIKIELYHENTMITKMERIFCIDFSPHVEYKSHVQNIGWQSNVSENMISGTEGKSYRVEAFKVKLINNDKENLDIEYQAHIQNIGWQGWKKSGEISGTEGKSLRIEAIRMKVKGNDEYSIEYRVHVQNKGWLKWRNDGEVAGTTGESLRIEAIQIRIVKKEKRQIDPEINYRSHVQNIGWQSKKGEGYISGTEGKGLRDEAISIDFRQNNSNWKVLYRAHVENIGWQGWKSNGQVAGTEGKGLRIEAIQIKLENLENYTVEYQVHIQDYGWSSWMIDGETAGTTGKAKRIEAIRIRIVPKYYRSYKGIDVSEFNGQINWKQVKDSGVQFAMIRCAYRGYRTGKIVKDNQFEYNIQNASAAGIKVGIYFFSQAVSISEAVEEANYAVNLARKYNCITYPIAIDTEASGAEKNDGRADGINAALRTNIMAAFCNQVQSSGYTPMIYASRNWFYNNLEVNRLLSYKTWLAHYTGNINRKSDYIYGYSMWQYTSSGSVPGIAGRVDMNMGYEKY